MFDKVYGSISKLDRAEALKNCGEDKDLCLEILKDYTMLTIKDELKGCVAANDFKNYCVKIHGFKNNSYLVGAKALGDLSFDMEAIAKNGFNDELFKMQDNLFQWYDDICDTYNNIMGG